MEYLYTSLLDDPQELCQWAKEDVYKAYKKSCSEAIRDISHNIAKRDKLNEEALQLAKELMAAHSKGDKELVVDVLYRIKKNIDGKLKERKYCV